ncbi:MAG: hypothetical protein LAN37_11860 [Acidobacteriia bacterium]|nr:hypothetical protein [Terriglobia bacterium]
MKRAGIIAVVLFAAAAMGQVRGVPASVTSQTSKGYTPGVPASVTSLGPNGWQGRSQFGTPPALPPTTFYCFGGGMVCAPGTGPSGSGGRRHHHQGSGYGYGGYGYVPYYYPAYPTYPMNYTDTAAPGYVQMEPSPAEDADPPAPTIFERRATTRPYARDEQRYDQDYRPPSADPRAKSAPISVGEVETTTLVYRNGREFDIHNYAIVGHTLFNLDGTGPFRIQLAELDVPATTKLNSDRGVDFKIPAN